MTNREKWLSYTSGLSSPQNFIDWAWRYIITASLQRRVWLGYDNQQCFPNQYIILTGPPGVGKGLVIKEVSYFLRFWKLKDAHKIYLNGSGDTLTQEQKNVIEAVKQADLDKANKEEHQPKNKKNEHVEPLLIPMAADATTYEALIAAVSNSYMRINYLMDNEKTGQKDVKVYGHSSMCFSLQELASLLRKRTDDTVNYLLGLYDCPIDYEYDTKTQGMDRVRKGCINLLAGTTPSFMERVFNQELVDEGLSSRTHFIYSGKNRKNQFFIPKRTEEQLGYRVELLDHVRRLASLYGEIIITDEVKAYLESWWDKFNIEELSKKDENYKLFPWLARLNIHIMKVALAEHFSEHTTLEIPLETFIKATEICLNESKTMHLAITMESKNPLAKISKKILDLLKIKKQMNLVDIITDMWESSDQQQTREAIDFLLETNQIQVDMIKDETTETTSETYTLKK